MNFQYPFSPETPLGGWDYHSGKCLVAAKEMPPLRVGLFTMERDFGSDTAATTTCNLTLAGQRMAFALKAKGAPHLPAHLLPRGDPHRPARHRRDLPGRAGVALRGDVSGGD